MVQKVVGAISREGLLVNNTSCQESNAVAVDGDDDNDDDDCCSYRSSVDSNTKCESVHK